MSDLCQFGAIASFSFGIVALVSVAPIWVVFVLFGFAVALIVVGIIADLRKGGDL